MEREEKKDKKIDQGNKFNLHAYFVEKNVI